MQWESRSTRRRENGHLKKVRDLQVICEAKGDPSPSNLQTVGMAGQKRSAIEAPEQRAMGEEWKADGFIWKEMGTERDDRVLLSGVDVDDKDSRPADAYSKIHWRLHSTRVN